MSCQMGNVLDFLAKLKTVLIAIVQTLVLSVKKASLSILKLWNVKALQCLIVKILNIVPHVLMEFVQLVSMGIFSMKEVVYVTSKIALNVWEDNFVPVVHIQLLLLIPLAENASLCIL